MTENKADKTTKEISSTIFFAPHYIIIGACLCSFFPGYGQTWIWVIGSYVFFILIWAIFTPHEQSPWTVVVWNYAYILGLLITMVNLDMGEDIYNYYEFIGVYEKYENQYNYGDTSAALNIANLYKNTTKLPTAIRNEYLIWIKIYADDAIDQKNQNAIVEIKSFGKHLIRGPRGNSYTDDSKTALGKTYYIAAYELGDIEAIIEMEREVEEAARLKIDAKKRYIDAERRYDEQQKKYQARLKNKPKDKSGAERLGELWGSAQKLVMDPVDEIMEDFNRGYKREN